MNPIFLGLAAGGILLIVLLHFVMGQTKASPLPEEGELRKRFIESMGEDPQQWAICETMAIALDPREPRLWVIFVHGHHVNVRNYGLETVLSCSAKAGGELDVRVRSFDRSRYHDKLQTGQEDAARELCEAVKTAGQKLHPTQAATSAA
ncbi:MAG: hypothetical protein H6728_06555 [Myxococcales bacterium]|nr:hypothetical protein [Myxococcales bacterium]